MDGPTQTVTVQIATQERVRTTTGPQWWDMPIIIKVPLVLPRGGGFSLTLPLKKGNEGMLIFCDTCLDFWWVNGQTNAPKADNAVAASGTQRQNEVRRHHFWDCGFLPGMCSQPNVLSDYSTDAAQLRSDDLSSCVSVASNEVRISADTDIALVAPAISATDGGTALALVNDVFYQWFVNVYMPSVRYVATAPAAPTGAETTVLKGQ